MSSPASPLVSPPLSPTLKTPPPTRISPHRFANASRSACPSTKRLFRTPPPSPLSSDSLTATSTPPILAELIQITVLAFTPDIITRLREFISHTPAFNLQHDLELLASLVTKHVAFSLQEHSPNTFRRSAYLAVKNNKILPTHLFDSKTPGAPTRRLSITRNFNSKSLSRPVHRGKENDPSRNHHHSAPSSPVKSASAIEPSSRSPTIPKPRASPVKQATSVTPSIPTSQRNAASKGDVPVDKTLKTPRRTPPKTSHLPTPRRPKSRLRTSRMHPRAGIESRIEIFSPTRAVAEVQRERLERDGVVSRLAQLRRQRLLRKRAQAAS